jgi:hypothetical protein
MRHSVARSRRFLTGASSFLLGGALAAALMKGPQWLRRRCPGMGAAVVVKRSSDDSMQGKQKLGSDLDQKGILNLCSKVSATVLYGTVFEACHQQRFIVTTVVNI